MRIHIADFTIATQDVAGLKGFYAALLGPKAGIQDHEFWYSIADEAGRGGVAVVPHDGNEMWDRPWITFLTDDFPAALDHLRKSGAQDIRNSGPTDDDGNPIGCVTFRDPEGRLMMLALEQ